MQCLSLGVIVAAGLAWGAHATELPEYGPELQGFAYAEKVAHYHFASQATELEMAYIDVAPAKPNGHTAVLLHGKNFCAGTWTATIEMLSAGIPGDRARPNRLL